MTNLRYSAVGIQNKSTMAITRDDYMKDIERLAVTTGLQRVDGASRPAG